MDFLTYQRTAKLTAIYPAATAVVYCALGLASEAGEVAGEVKKQIRDGSDRRPKIREEMGDVLWYLAMLAEEHGWTLDEIAEENAEKLRNRHARLFGG